MVSISITRALRINF